MDRSLWTIVAIELVAAAVLLHRLSDLGLLTTSAIPGLKQSALRLLGWEPAQCGLLSDSIFVLYSDSVILPAGVQPAFGKLHLLPKHL